jgi:hypothetical protein
MSWSDGESEVCAKKCNSLVAPQTRGEILEKWLSIKNMSNGRVCWVQIHLMRPYNFGDIAYIR